MVNVEKRSSRVIRVEDEQPFCPVNHHETRSWQLLTKGEPPYLESLELSIAEIEPDGWIDDHVHESDHIYLITAGEALAVVDGEEFRLSCGACLYIPKGAPHEMRVVGDDVLRFAVMWTPARAVEIANAAEPEEAVAEQV